MKRIILVCSAGMSTSILVEKMKTEAANRGLEVNIIAKANAGLESERGNWDCCLVGPQIRFAQAQVADALQIPTEVIDMRTYGMGDGAAALDQALALIK